MIFNIYQHQYQVPNQYALTNLYQISKDLAKVLDIKMDVAERIKVESGECVLNDNIKDK